MMIRYLTTGLALIGTLLAGANTAAAQVCGSPSTTSLIAGQHYDAGTVTVYNDATNIYVQYSLTSPWVLSDAHVAVATTLSGIPQTKAGNPIPGRFSYSATFDPELTTYTFVVPRNTIADGQTIYVAAHGVVHAPKNEGGSQTAWGAGMDFPGANWATYIAYQVKSCGGGGPE